jgi:ligand-binding SRPBCC domain-containing protein
LDFRVVTPEPIEMQVGTLIDYRLKLRGLPFGWRTRITAWEPPHRFEDTQLKGPYRLWVHEHTFEPHPQGTLCTDRVRYAVPGGPLVHWLLVRRDVEAIFDYRERVLRDIFQDPALNSAA